MKAGIQWVVVLTAGVCWTVTVSPLAGSSGQSAPSPVVGEIPPAASAAPPPRRPNVVLITVDDMMASDLAFMPRTRRLLVRRGTTFTQGLAPTSICVPARASQLSGQYAHNHGAVTVEGVGGGVKAFRDTNTLPVWLRRAGYDTLYLGKYLNGYGDTRRTARYVPPGWSGWRATLGESTHWFHKTRFNLNGRVTTIDGYSTDVLARFTTEMLDHQHDVAPRKPFFLSANYAAPHQGGPRESDDPRVHWGPVDVYTTMPAPRHRNRFRGVDVPQVPEMWKRTRSAYSGPRVPRGFRAAVREMYQQRLESLLAVDQAVQRTVATLRRNGDLARTLIVFTSDNGFLTGHHNRVGKLVPWDSSSRVPMVVRGPGVPHAERASIPITHADVAVSIAAAAHARPGRTVDGLDVLGRVRSDPHARRIIPISGYPVSGGTRPVFTGIRFGAWTYSRLRNGHEELYHRATDPGELRNLAGRERYRDELATFREWNRRYRRCAGNECPMELDPSL
jgi:arylsulfatase A-like enzyme